MTGTWVWTVFLATSIAAAQQAPALNCKISNYDISQIVDYIKAASTTNVQEFCIRAAYDRLSVLPVQDRVPTLLHLMSVPIPDPPRGSVIVSGGGYGTEVEFHPAVEALTMIGQPALSKVVDYIATDPDRSERGWLGAIYVCVIVLHSHSAISALKADRDRRRPSEAARLTDAVNLIVKKYCWIDMERKACADAMSSP